MPMVALNGDTKMSDKTIVIPVHNIVIELTDESIRHTNVKKHFKAYHESRSIYGGGSISSDLREDCPYCGQPGCYLHCDESQAGGFEEGEKDKETEEDMWERKAFNDIMDGLEAFILTMATSGCDVESDQFIEALESALETIGNNV